MESTTAATLITDAYTLLNVITLGTAPSARLSAQGFRFLNAMVGTWAQKPLTIPAIRRDTFALQSGKGSPSNPYTWGIGGDINTDPPQNQQGIQVAKLVLTSSSPNVEVQLATLTDDAYNAIPIKDLASNQPTCFYFNPTFQSAGLASVNLWPIPLQLSNLIAVYRTLQLTKFATLSTTYYFPDGYIAAFMFNLAKWMANAGGRSLMPETAELAVSTFAEIQSSNMKMSDMANDLTVFSGENMRTGYNINTGTGG